MAASRHGGKCTCDKCTFFRSLPRQRYRVSLVNDYDPANAEVIEAPSHEDAVEVFLRRRRLAMHRFFVRRVSGDLGLSGQFQAYHGGYRTNVINSVGPQVHATEI